MTLRTRLAVALACVVLVPLLVGVLVTARVVGDRSEAEAAERVTAAASALAALVDETCARVTADAALLAAVPAAERPARARELVMGGSAVLLTDPAGGVLLAAGREAPSPTAPAPAADCASGTAQHGLLGASVPAPEGGRATVSVGVRLDDARARRWAATVGTDVLVLAGDRLLATSGPAPADLRDDDVLVRRADPLGTPALRLLVALRHADDALPLPLTLALLLAAATALAGAAVSRLVTRPLEDLGAAAERVAAGDLEAAIPATGDEEVDRLAAALTDVAGDLQQSVSALEQSRAALRDSLARLGDTLSSTHDLSRLLSVVLDSAVAAVGARAGAVLLSSGRADLAVRASTGLEGRLPAGTAPEDVRLPVGAGVIGGVAADARPVRGRPADGTVVPDPREPRAVDVMGVPLAGKRGVVGVLVLYERVDGRPFDDDDLRTLETLGRQSAVAVDNVLLHQEAQRLSLTDGLTGLWNQRYFTMSLTRETERSARFRRPLALLMLDLDRFKAVNDTHGHQRGDSVLVELAARLAAETRDVDTLARYGGEEFVLLLPETDVRGAELAAARIREVVRSTPFGGPGESPLDLTVSVGVAVHPDCATTGRALVRAADEALYAAKAAGRDAYRTAAACAPAPTD